MSHEKKFTSSEFLSFLSSLNKFKIFNEFYLENDSHRPTEFDFLWKKKDIPEIPSSFLLSPDEGCLIDMSKHKEMLMNWFDDKLYELKMIYRGTEHEFTKQSWDELCFNKGPSLTVIQSTKGQIVGGFTSKSMCRSKNDWSFTEDDKAWIFSFDHRK